jgi:hypothetical protein
VEKLLTRGHQTEQANTIRYIKHVQRSGLKVEVPTRDGREVLIAVAQILKQLMKSFSSLMKSFSSLMKSLKTKEEKPLK